MGSVTGAIEKASGGRYVTEMSTIADSNDPEEAELWRRVLAGERAAFRVLHARFDGRLVLFLRSRCRPPLDADEIAQTVWLRVWERRAQWDSQKGKFINWLLQIASNERDTELRVLQRRPTRQIGEDCDQVAPCESEPDPGLQALRDCLKELGGPFVEVLKLRLLEELSDADLAGRLKITVTTVYTRASRGRAEVRQCVERKLS